MNLPSRDIRDMLRGMLDRQEVTLDQSGEYTKVRQGRMEDQTGEDRQSMQEEQPNSRRQVRLEDMTRRTLRRPHRDGLI